MGFNSAFKGLNNYCIIFFYYTMPFTVFYRVWAGIAIDYRCVWLYCLCLSLPLCYCRDARGSCSPWFNCITNAARACYVANADHSARIVWRGVIGKRAVNRRHPSYQFKGQWYLPVPSATRLTKPCILCTDYIYGTRSIKDVRKKNWRTTFTLRVKKQALRLTLHSSWWWWWLWWWW